MVAGKGGVGKSTVCAALALSAARRGKKVLICELASKERAPYLFGRTTPSGYDGAEIYPGIESINVSPAPALQEYGLMKLRFKRLYRLVFENPVMKSLVRMMPGMNELVLIGKAWYLEQEMDPERGGPRWDLIIVDAPATGHGMSLLVLPHVILETVTTGPLAEETGRIRDLLMDRERTCLNVVTLPEEMPVNESLDLLKQVDEKIGMQTGYLFVNGVWPAQPGERDLARLTRLSAGGDTDPRFAAAEAVTRFMVRRRHAQEGYIERLRRECDLPQVEIGYQFRDEFAFEAIDAVSRTIDVGLKHHEHNLL